MNKLFLTVVFIMAVLLIVSCGGATESTTAPTIETTATTTRIPGPPSPEELAAQGFLLPELPRITCEQLKQMMDNGEPLVVVDTRIELFFNMEHIPQSINITYRPDEENPEGFLTLPKDKPIIFYCD